jgi:hypothetical protein
MAEAVVPVIVPVMHQNPPIQPSPLSAYEANVSVTKGTCEGG